MAKESAPKVGRLPTLVTESKSFFADTRAGNVDAILGNEFFVARQVDGGDGVFCAITASAAGGGKNAEGAAEQVARAAGAAFGEQFADVADETRSPRRRISG